MFDFVRKHTKWMMFLMFLLIIPAFVLVGVDGFRQIGAGGEAVAKVGSTSITQGEWDFAHKNEVDRMRQSMPNLDAKLLDSAPARYEALERLVHEKVLTEAVQDARMTTSDARLARELQRDQTIASLRKPDGSLDMERYRQLAANQGLSPEGFEARIRRDLSMQQVESGVLVTSFSPKVLVDTALNAFYERREIQVARFSPSDYASKVTPAEADLEAFYGANAALFKAPESADIEYLLLDLESIKKTIALNEQDLKAYYEQNVARLSGKEERRASHVLITAPKTATEADRKKARERADALLADLRKAPDSFADVARKNSQDPGSAPNGGDLDFFGRGAMVKPFEEAAFALKKGEISSVVESDFGFHIIKLTDIKAPKQKTFEELRASMESDLKTQQAQRKFAEVAEAFTNGVYEQSDGLKPVAEKLKLELKTATNVQRKATPAATGALANAKFLMALFSSDSIEKKRNTEAVELGANQLVAGRIIQYTPARTIPLQEVRNLVRDRLIASRAAELAKKDGIEKLAAWKSGAAATLAAPTVVSREQGQSKNFPGAMLDAVLRADPTTLPAWIGVDLGNQGYAIARITKILPRDGATAVASAAQEQKQYAQWISNAENQAYYEVLKDRFKVEIKPKRPSKASLATQGAEAQ
jgi:peptidyl-prolyl cis-trans isomerase D